MFLSSHTGSVTRLREIVRRLRAEQGEDRERSVRVEVVVDGERHALSGPRERERDLDSGVGLQLGRRPVLLPM